MDRDKFMRVKYKYFLEDIWKYYKLDKIFDNNYIYICLKKGVYGLKQDALLIYENLKQVLLPYGYMPVPETVGL